MVTLKFSLNLGKKKNSLIILLVIVYFVKYRETKWVLMSLICEMTFLEYQNIYINDMICYCTKTMQRGFLQRLESVIYME